MRNRKQALLHVRRVVVKVGTKVKNIRLVDGDHDIDCKVPGVGAMFDPNLHDAVVREVSPDHQEGEILDQFRKGYLIKDRLLRPSQVRVAVQPRL